LRIFHPPSRACCATSATSTLSSRLPEALACQLFAGEVQSSWSRSTGRLHDVHANGRRLTPISCRTFIYVNVKSCPCLPKPTEKQWVEDYLRDNGLTDYVKILRVYDMSLPRGSAHHTCHMAPVSHLCTSFVSLAVYTRHLPPDSLALYTGFLFPCLSSFGQRTHCCLTSDKAL